MSDAATENLKVIKVLHQLLMAATAAIFAFAARPDLAPEYKNALGELAALRQVWWGGWSNYIASRCNETLDKNKKVLWSWIREAGLPVRNGAAGPIIPVSAGRGATREHSGVAWSQGAGDEPKVRTP